jgi:hypothetical protein
MDNDITFLNDEHLADLKKLLASEQLKYEALNYCVDDANDKKKYGINFAKKFFETLNRHIDVYNYNNLSLDYFLTEIFNTNKDLLPAELRGKVSFSQETTKYRPLKNLDDSDSRLYNNFTENSYYFSAIAKQIFSGVFYKQLDKFDSFNKGLLSTAISKSLSDFNEIENFTETHLLLNDVFDKDRFEKLIKEDGLSEYKQYFLARVLSSKIMGMRLFSADYNLGFKPDEFIKVKDLTSLNNVSGHLGLKEQINRKEQEIKDLFSKYAGTDKLVAFNNSIEEFVEEFYGRLNLSAAGVDINEGKRGRFN